jgi:hypothetical protein
MGLPWNSIFIGSSYGGVHRIARRLSVLVGGSGMVSSGDAGPGPAGRNDPNFSSCDLATKAFCSCAISPNSREYPCDRDRAGRCWKK